MKLLFVYPPSVYLNHAMFKHYTYFAETINLVASDGYCVDVVDCGVELYDRRYIYAKLKGIDVLILLVEPYNIKISLSIARIAKDVNSHCHVIIYGTAASLIPNYFSKKEAIDFIVADGFFYEGISRALGNIEHCEGQHFKVLVNNGKMESKRWGSPLSELIPLERYRKYGNNMLELTVQTGCPYNCSFCSEKILFGGKYNCIYNQRPVSDIVPILSKASGNFSSVYFSATTFTYDRVWVIGLCDSIISEKICLPWRSDTRIDCLDEELLRKMKEAGLKQLSIGIESFDANLLQRVRKGVNADSIYGQIKMCQDEGIVIKALLILGIPGQTAAEVRRTQEIVRELHLPYRWKEYSPIRELHEADFKGEDVEALIDTFDRTNFNTNSVAGLSPREYMELLFPDDYKR